jgi:hypothetical protein
MLYYDCFVCAMWKKSKLSSDVGDPCSKKLNSGYGEVWHSLHLAGVWNLVVSFVLVYLAEIWLQSLQTYFQINLHYKEFYKYCSFNAVCKHKVAINCITVKSKKVSFLSVHCHAALVM